MPTQKKKHEPHDNEVFEWVGPRACEKSTIAYYHRLYAETEDGGAFEVGIGDAVHLHSGEGDPYIGEVESMFEDKITGEKFVRTRWFFRPSDIPQDLRERYKDLTDQDIFQSNLKDDNHVHSIEAKPTVAFLAADDDGPVVHDAMSRYTYICRYKYIPKKTGDVLLRQKVRVLPPIDTKARKPASAPKPDAKRRRHSELPVSSGAADGPTKAGRASTGQISKDDEDDLIDEASDDSEVKEVDDADDAGSDGSSHEQQQPSMELGDERTRDRETSGHRAGEGLVGTQSSTDSHDVDVVSFDKLQAMGSDDQDSGSHQDGSGSIADTTQGDGNGGEEDVANDVEVHVVASNVTDDYFSQVWKKKWTSRDSRIGSKFQADVPPYDPSAVDTEKSLAVHVWDPSTCDDEKLDTFLDQANAILREHMQSQLQLTDSEPKQEDRPQAFFGIKSAFDGTLLMVSTDFESCAMRNLFEHGGDTKAALRDIAEHAGSYITQWSPVEQQKFNEAMRQAGEDLVVVEKKVAPKSRQEVIDYYYRYIFPAQELQHAVDKLTGKRYREARSVTLKKRKTESAPYSVQLAALEFLKKGREVLDDASFGQLLGCLMEYQTDVVSVSQLIIRVQAICRTAHPELFRDFCDFLPRDYRAAVVVDTVE